MAALALTYALAVFEERECPVPRVQMHPDDRALAKPRGEVCLVTLVMQQSLKRHTLHSIESLRSRFAPILACFTASSLWYSLSVPTKAFRPLTTH